jgi:hypothetical protein
MPLRGYPANDQCWRSVQVKKIRLLERHNVAEASKRASDCARASPPKGGQLVRTGKVFERAYIAGCGDGLQAVSLERGGQWLNEMLQCGAYAGHEKHALNSTDCHR